MGGLVGYIDSTDVAFDGREMGVFMVLMAILGGKGTLWGPVIGATLFHIFKEGFWTFFLGWQYVCLLYTSPSPRDGLLSRMPSSA